MAALPHPNILAIHDLGDHEGTTLQGRMKLLALIKGPASIARTLPTVGEATEVPRRSPGRGPPYWKSRVLRLKVLAPMERQAAPRRRCRCRQRPFGACWASSGCSGNASRLAPTSASCENRARSAAERHDGGGMSALSLKVNGRARAVEVDPATPLLYVLSDELGLRGPKFGCGLAQCGSCTALVDGRAIRSCVTPVGSVVGAEITTLEGLGTPENPHPIQKAFIEEQAAQCGFCLNGVILTAKALLDREPKATDERIRQELATVLCRCFVHLRMMRAIRRYARERTT